MMTSHQIRIVFASFLLCLAVAQKNGLPPKIGEPVIGEPVIGEPIIGVPIIGGPVIGEYSKRLKHI